jgi:hypothetical protein
MPVLIEDVEVLRLDGQPNAEHWNAIFTQDTEIEIPDWIPIDMTTGPLRVVRAMEVVGLARLSSIDFSLRVDVAIHHERIAYLNNHVLFPNVEIHTLGSEAFVKKFSIKSMTLRLSSRSLDGSMTGQLPQLGDYRWTDTKNIKIPRAV